MQTIIHFLIDLSVAGFIFGMFILAEKYISYRRFKKNFHAGQYIHFFVGHEQRFGVIVKINFTKAHVRDALDMKEYDKHFYQIHKPYMP